MMKRLVAWTAFLLCLLALPVAADDYQILEESTTRIGRFERTDAVVQVGDNPVNTFLMHRLVRRGGPYWTPPPRGILLLTGPLANPFVFWETTEDGRYGRSFAAYFARRGYEIWGYSPRGTLLEQGSCEAGLVDCSVMGDWGIQVMVEDLTFIRGEIEQVHPGRSPVIGGFSLGGAATIATINAHPDDYAGALILEGALYSEDPEVIALNQQHCATMEDFLAQGFLFDGQSLPLIGLTANLAATDPDGETPFPGFPPGTTNHQVLVFSLAVPSFTPLNQTPNFIRAAGDPLADVFFFSTDARLTAFLTIFNNYFDNRILRDLNCSFAGERTFTGNLANFTKPVFFMGGGQSFGPQNRDLAKILGSHQCTFVEIEEFGHGDHFFSADHRRFVERPIRRFLNRIDTW
ncbi:MAG: alpha/beta hydrolase [Acidobacteriota bacterium]